MALPKISQPTYKIYFHSIKKEVEYRPYTVGEEKILIMVSESTDPKYVSTNMKRVLQACILDPDVNVGQLASYDVENLLLKIRSKSSGETVDIKYVDPTTNKTYEVTIDLEKLDVTFNPDHDYKIEITDKIGLLMTDLTFEKMLSYQEQLGKLSNSERAGLSFESIIDCIDSVYDEESVYKVGVDTTRDEVLAFINGLSGISHKLYKFMETMPSMEYKILKDDGTYHRIRDIKSFLV